MPTKVFITGSTGYIGGTVLDAIVKSHPEYDITALLRTTPDNFAGLFPNVKVIQGDYNSADLISNAASEADIVVHNGDSDHEPSIKAIIAGLISKTSTGYLIHLSGTGIVADWREGRYEGRLNPKVWSDLADIDEITSRPDAELHRNVDKIIQDAARTNSSILRTAIVCPPDIYGPGKGPGRTSSVYFPTFVKVIKKVGAPFYGGDGTNTRSWVHIDDLMKLYLGLIEAAAAGGGTANWGVDGYYFAATQEHSQIEIAKATGTVLKRHGILKSAKTTQIPLETIADTMSDRTIPRLGTYMFAANSRTRADRASKVLRYKPSAPDLWDTLEADLLASHTID